MSYGKYQKSEELQQAFTFLILFPFLAQQGNKFHFRIFSKKREIKRLRREAVKND